MGCEDIRRFLGYVFLLDVGIFGFFGGLVLVSFWVLEMIRGEELFGRGRLGFG